MNTFSSVIVLLEHYDISVLLALLDLFACRCLVREQTFAEILRELTSQVDVNGKKNIVNVTRSDLLEDGFRAFERKSFNPAHLLNVRFSGEDSIDSGGVTREFLRLIIVHINNMSLFCGKDNNKYLNLDYKGMPV